MKKLIALIVVVAIVAVAQVEFDVFGKAKSAIQNIFDNGTHGYDVDYKQEQGLNRTEFILDKDSKKIFIVEAKQTKFADKTTVYGGDYTMNGDTVVANVYTKEIDKDGNVTTGNDVTNFTFDINDFTASEDKETIVAFIEADLADYEIDKIIVDD